jgi:hypothetical protein
MLILGSEERLLLPSHLPNQSREHSCTGEGGGGGGLDQVYEADQVARVLLFQQGAGARPTASASGREGAFHSLPAPVTWCEATPLPRCPAWTVLKPGA